jgi:hypothetical protein
MKTKYSVALVATGLALAATLFAAEQSPAKALPNVIKLKVHGEVVAEVRFYKDFALRLKQKRGSGAAPRQMMIEVSPKGHLPVGDWPITVTAEEIELSREK